VLRTAVSQHEVRFGPIELEIDGLRFRVAGSIDRVEVGADDRIDDADAYRAIVDYKSSTSSLPGKGKTAAFDDGIVVQAPLYAMALEHAEPAAVMARIEYRVLRTGKSALSLGLVGVDPKAKAIEPDDQAAERYERSRMAIPAAIRRARGGAFPAEPAPSNGCPPFCPALDTCRIRGGPKLDSW
jgi:hypothetical protein